MGNLLPAIWLFVAAAVSERSDGLNQFGDGVDHFVGIAQQGGEQQNPDQNRALLKGNDFLTRASAFEVAGSLLNQQRPKQKLSKLIV